MATITFIRTKLHRPPVPRDLVERPRLVEKLNQGRERKLTLVSAPADYGKSTAVSAWVETLNFPAAWLSLDEYDDDLVTFGAYLATAVRIAYPEACQHFTILLGASTLPPPHRLADAFLSDLEALLGPLAVVLDDYHAIHSPEIHSFMQRATHYLPTPVQLVLTTRQDPPLDLSTLRARRQVLDIDGEDLLFTPDEARAMISRLASKPINDEIITLLSERTEGWPVGLQMAAISLRDSRDSEAFAQRFAQTRHYLLMEYLLSEALGELDPLERLAAMQLAIVDRFCVDLCEAVVRLPGSVRINGEVFIRKLLRANLFIISLDHAGVWYRFHHLFADLLRQRLQRTYTEEAIARMHARASAWFAAQGLIDEAIGHALAAGDVVGAAELVEAHRIELLNADQWRILEKWLDRLPDDIKAQRPHLLLAQAWVFNTRHAIWAIPPILERLAPLLADVEPEPAVQGEIDYFRGVLQYWQGQGERSLASLERALDLLPPTYSQNRGEVWFYWGLSAQQIGKGDEAVSVLTRTFTEELARESNRSDALMARLAGSRTAVHFVAAQLFEAHQTLQQIRMLAEQSENVYIDVWSLYSLGIVYFGWYDLDKAAACFQQVAQNVYANHVRAAIDNLAGLAMTRQALGASEKARDVLGRLYEFIAETRMFVYAGLAQSCEARLALLQGDLDAAMRWQKGADLTADTGSMFFWLETPRITQCRVLVADGSPVSLEAADAKLRQYIEENQALHNHFQLIHLLPLQALLQQKQGKTEEALATLQQAVALGEPGGWIQPFAEVGAEIHPLLQMLLDQGGASDYVRRLLTSTQPSMAAPAVQGQLALSPPLDLTNRDLDVLELLAQRLTNQEIADRLFLSPQTVKNYTHRLYRKLHVNSRRQAVAEARALGILPDPD